MSRDGYVDKRGSNRDRAARRAWLLATFDPDLGDERARCAMNLSGDCLKIVDVETLSVDRIEQGGTYARHNIRPGCKPCQDRQGGLTTAARSWVVDSYRHARDAVLGQRESGMLAPTSVRGTNGTAVAMHQLEDDEFREHVPAPLFRDWLVEQKAARLAAEDDARSARSERAS
jgi:hypothetical protein